MNIERTRRVSLEIHARSPSVLMFEMFSQTLLSASRSALGSVRRSFHAGAYKSIHDHLKSRIINARYRLLAQTPAGEF